MKVKSKRNVVYDETFRCCFLDIDAKGYLIKGSYIDIIKDGITIYKNTNIADIVNKEGYFTIAIADRIRFKNNGNCFIEIVEYSYNHITCIQSVIRRYLCKKELMSLKDGMTYELLLENINDYNDHLKFNEYMNKKMKVKKIRNENFRSEISENIAKFAIFKKYGIMPNWDCKGDLVMLNKQLEIKGFMSNGPLSFGPTEPWHYIYFVDALQTRDKIYKVYEIKLSNTSEIWRNIVISGKDSNYEYCDIPDNLESLKHIELKELCRKRGLNITGTKKTLIHKLKHEEVGSGTKPKLTYGDIADADKRGKLRAPFYDVIKKQIEGHCKLIFNGYINELK